MATHAVLGEKPPAEYIAFDSRLQMASVFGDGRWKTVYIGSGDAFYIEMRTERKTARIYVFFSRLT